MYGAKARSTANGIARRILLVQHASDLSGSTLSGQLVARGFRREGWDVDVVFEREGAGLARYREIGCNCHILPHKSWLRGGNELQSTRRMLKEVIVSREFVRLIRQIRPDLVYINTIVSLAAALAARLSRIPCVWHIRELFDDVGGEMCVPAFGGKTLVRGMLGLCADHIVTISQAVRDNVLGTSHPAKTSVVFNAVDESFSELAASREHCRRVFDLPLDGMLIGVPGTLRPSKGHEFFLDAAAIAQRLPGWKIAVTGGGEAAFVDRLQQLVRERALQDRVRFLGSISRMAEFYRACDIVCVPSKSEPFGRTVIEAFAVGVPVVASAVGGIRETVRNEENGLLVEYGDVPALVCALTRLLQDAALRERLRSAGRKDACELYSASAYFEHINRVVRQVVDSRAACGDRSSSNEIVVGSR